MSDFLNYFWTVLTRLWDILSYPFRFVSIVCDYVSDSWATVKSYFGIFPAWIAGTLLLILVLGIVLFVLKR